MSLKRDWQDQIVDLLTHTDRAYLVALRATGDAASAEESVQEAFAQLLQHPPVNVHADQLTSYFFGVVRNVALNSRRSSRRLKTQLAHSAPLEASSDPDDIELTQEAVELAVRAVAQLATEEREVVSLCCELGFTQRVASEILNTPVQTVADRLQRGLQKLRRVLFHKGYSTVPPASLRQALQARRGEGAWQVVRFSDEHCAEWQTALGLWGREKGEWVSKGLENLLIWNHEVPRSFRFIAEGWIEDQGELSIVGRRIAPECKRYTTHTGYYFQCGAEFNSCAKLARGVHDVAVRIGPLIQPGRRYRLELSYDDDHGILHCALNGKRLLSYRELAPFAGSQIGFYAYGKGAHVMPIEVQKQDWGQTIPPLRAADRLLEHRHYAEALACYSDIAQTSSAPDVVIQARLKVGISQALLGQARTAEASFRLLAGTSMASFALAEAALQYLRNNPGEDCRRGLRIFNQLFRKFPASQAKLQTLEAARNYRIENVIHGQARDEDLQIRAEIQRLASRSLKPPAGSQIKCAMLQSAYELRRAEWKKALAHISAFAAQLRPGQKAAPSFDSAYLSAVLANGRDALLPADVFALNDWLLEEWMNWSSGVVLHCVVRRGKQRDFLQRLASGQRPAFSTGWQESFQAALVRLSLGDSEGWDALIAQPKNWSKGGAFHFNAYRLGAALVEARLQPPFAHWKQAVTQLSENHSPTQYRYSLRALQARWELEAGELDAAAAPLEGLAPPPMGFLFTEGFLFQVLLSSLGRLRCPTREQLSQHYAQVLTGCERQLAELFLGKSKLSQVKWPDARWRPEWRLWTALWLDAQDERKAAEQVMRTALAPGYGLAHSQVPAGLLLGRMASCKANGSSN